MNFNQFDYLQQVTKQVSVKLFTLKGKEYTDA